ncbi:hypothetical protein DL764_004825 [Monosporascus ibericus]|uniref:MIF4G domain-containing protein n=1 Tax=Monosporascus ibericus TaxID=155417 RepID=A0A4V1XAT9_9PEZI|nr:hypothetical protein DL764_004825 [Monosporascus ibericus]
MTSPAPQKPTSQATTSSANPPAPSYASAAGAAKKQSSAPVVATGSSQPVVAAGSSVSTPNHAKSSSISPMNGRPNIMPAVPAVAHGTSSANGHSDPHNRTPSVTITNGPSTYSNSGAGASKNGIQFGFNESPAVPPSVPQPVTAAIPIPGAGSNPRATSPANSPSPIPRPSASGGRPPSSTQQGGSMTFGSFTGAEGDHTHMRTPSMSQDPHSLGSQHSPHMRRNSSHSHADMNNQPIPPQGGMGRGSFSAGRGRGGFGNNFNSHHNTGYPPNTNYPRGPPNQGRGGVPGSFPNNRQQPYGTPPPTHRSPALPPAMPQAHNMPPNMPPFYYQPPPMGPTQVQQVTPPSLPFPIHESQHMRTGKRKGPRRDSEKYSGHTHQADSFKDGQEYGHRNRRFSKRLEYPRVFAERAGSVQPGKAEISHSSDQSSLLHHLQPPFTAHPHLSQKTGITIDLSPESGNFDRLLTSAKQGYYPGHYDPNMRQGMPMQGYPAYPMMHGQGQSPAPNYQMPYTPGPFNAPGGHPMSRGGSQVSVTTDNRPASSASQNPAPVAQGTPQPHPASVKPPVVQSPQFTRPARKSAAIVIKNEQGEALDLSRLKAPASPAPNSQSSKTPPVVSSTPTPPPKPSTPQISAPAHSRSESITTTKTAEEVRNEFKEKMKQAASGEKPKEEEVAKAPDEENAEVEKTKEEENERAEEQKQDEAKAAEEAKAKQEAEEKPKADTKPAEPDSKEETSKDEEEDEIERAIREMEEAEAKREKAEEEHRARKKIEAELKKKADEEAKVANAAENDRKLREAEAEMERLEMEKEKRAKEREARGENAPSLQELLAGGKESSNETASSTSEATAKLGNLSLNDKPAAASSAKSSTSGRGPKPAALNLAPLKTNSVEPPQPSAALQSLKTARLLDVIKADMYPPGIHSPNPALNAAVAKKGTSFKYDPNFLLQFKAVFTEQPSLDFHQQVKTLIGDGDGGSRSATVRPPAGGSGRQNSRGGASAFPAMGSFGATGGRTLPPGTTSEQRMAMSSGNMPRPAMNPMGNFPGPRGGFPGGASMSRTSSNANMGNIPNSPRQGSRAGRNASKQSGFSAKVEAQAAKTMPLTQGLKIEALSTSSTGWKPTSIGKPAQAAVTPDGHLDPAMVQRKVKAALNKMTPENFDKISGQILEIAGQSKDETDGRTLRQVIQLTFEKATDEAHWASMYAKFCKRMLEMMSPEIRDENIRDKSGQVVSGGALFRKYLLNRCQEEFERGWKISLPAPPEGGDKKSLDAVMLSDEYYLAAAAKRRGLGLVQFIGELYKLGMLTERIMHECVKKLVDYQGTPDEAEIESLSKLLRTIGANLDATEKGKFMMDAYFQRIEGMMNIPDLPSRLKFMLMDVVDLRRANWVSKEANKGPKTLEEVRAEAEAAAAQKAAEAARSNTRGGPGGRPPAGRGDARGYPSGFPQAAPNQVGMDDLRRLKGGANRASSSNVTLGPTSMFGSRSNSGRRLGPGGSLSHRGPEDSGASSRTGTPPVKESSTNAFSLLANMGESEHPASPPSTTASPALSKAVPDTSGAAGEGN